MSEQERVKAIVNENLRNPITWTEGLCPGCGITNQVPMGVVYAQCPKCLTNFIVQAD